jgi:hypothetical protein
MIKSQQIEDLAKQGFHSITAITKLQIDKLLRTGTFQMELFEQELAEVLADEGVRYVLRRNPMRAQEMRDTRHAKLATLQAPEANDIYHLKFSPDATQLAILYRHGPVHVWDLRLIRQQLAANNIAEVEFNDRVLLERASTLFQALQPQECSIYDPYFWYHERFWKLGILRSHLAMFDGTPFKGFIWRLLGVRIGKRVFDDGCYITERTMVSIGDGCTLNSKVGIATHSQEDGGFKSGCITIGAGCTLGVNSLVHYGVKMGDGAQLAADAFLMKGEEVPPHTRWEGNPASQV